LNETTKIREVIEKEFSLEILLKNQERKTIEAEKAKVEISLKQLEQCHAAGGMNFLPSLHVSL
jgi:ADA HAT complex component 1